MTNKDKIIQKATKLGLTLGCWHETINKLDEESLSKVLESMEYQTDTDVYINDHLHVVEIDVVGYDIDFSVLTQEQYIERYGDARWELD